MTTELETKSAAFMAAAERLPRILSLTEETVYLLALLEESDEPELVERRAEVEALLTQKLDRAAWTVRDLERLGDMREDEERKLHDQKKRIRGAADRLKSLMLESMQQTGQTRIETPRYTIRIQRNPPSVKFTDEPATERVEAYERPPADVPLKYVTQFTLFKVDKRAILQAATKDGEVVPGVEIARGESLRIT